MRYSWLIILILLSCKKKSDFSNISVLGHASTGLMMENSVYHDNSNEAFEFALSISGCDGVEIDVQLSKDGDLWLFHDPELSVETNGTGCISELNSAEIATLRYATLHKEKLVRLDQLDLSYLKNKTLLIDVRHFNHCANEDVDMSIYLNALISSGLLAHSEFTTYCVLTKKSWIQPFKDAGFNVLLTSTGADVNLNLFTNYPALDGLMVKNEGIERELVEEVRNLGKKVYIFEMRSPKGIRRALRKYPDGLVTDDIRATLIEKY